MIGAFPQLRGQEPHGTLWAWTGRGRHIRSGRQAANPMSRLPGIGLRFCPNRAIEDSWRPASALEWYDREQPLC
jgi:hypothetical protein